MFPIIPFLSEYLWRNVVRELDKNAPISVALNGYNIGEYKIKDAGYTEKTNTVRTIFALASKLRNENQIKVKQPLKTMYINGDKKVAEAVELYKDIISSELNVKNVLMEHDNSKFNTEYLVLDFRKAGAVLKGEVQKVKNLLNEASDEDMKKYVAGFKAGKVKINGMELNSDLFIVNNKPKADFVIGTENNITVVLDVTLDRELMLEGLARELIRSAQVLRKLAGFNVEDRIDIQFVSDSSDINEIVTKFADKIKSELLVRNITKIEKPEYSDTIEIGDETVLIKLKR